MIKIEVFRYDPLKDDKSHLKTFMVEEKEKMKVLDALNYINEHYDANLAYRSSCRAGQCGSCAVKLNGQMVLACKAEISDGDIIEPLDFDVIKDLVVDRSPLDARVKEMQLFLEDECAIPECPAIIKPEEIENSKKLRSCIECLSCLSACPALKDTSEFAGPYYMRYLGKFALDPRDCADRAITSFDEGIYCCTSCAKCVEVCPKEINTFGGAIEKLRELCCQEGVGPLPPHKTVKELIEKTGRSVEPLGEGPMGEGFIKGLSKRSGKKSKIAFFTGCMIDYRLPEVGKALLDVLKKQGIDVIVPSEQICCGSPMIRTGQTDIVENLIKKNQKIFQEYDTIITVCAGCGATLKNDYPRYGVKLNVIDISEFLSDQLNTEDMKPLNMQVTYHDPCHLARGQGIREAPREILEKLKNVEFVEMEEPDRCCGSGGGVRSGKPDLAAKMGKRKADMIEKLEVDAVVTICPFCEYHIRDALKKQDLDIEVLNILNLLSRAYQC